MNQGFCLHHCLFIIKAWKETVRKAAKQMINITIQPEKSSDVLLQSHDVFKMFINQ